MEARCERGAEIALMLGFDPETAEGIRTLDEHWDGGGQPRGLRGEEIPLLGRILCLAQTAEIFHAAGGAAGGATTSRAQRSGGWFDPALVDAFAAVAGDAAFWEALHDDDLGTWEPGERHIAVDEDRLDRIADAFAGIIDAKSPWTYRHSDRACLIVMGVAAALGADDAAAARPAPRRAPARHRQARGLQPDPRQARPAHARGVRRGSASTR